MSQSRLSSFAESVVGTAIGFLSSLAMNYLILPLYGFTPSLSQNVQMVLWFTVLSIIRSYFVRRMWVAEWWKFLFRKN